MISIIAFVTAKPGMLEKLRERFQANVPLVLAEEGCHEYAGGVDLADGPSFQTRLGPDTFAVIEKWDSAQALARHVASPHMAAFGVDTRDWVTSKVIHIVQMP